MALKDACSSKVILTKHCKILLCLCLLGMGRTWGKFLSLPAKKTQKCVAATGKEKFWSNRVGSH